MGRRTNSTLSVTSIAAYLRRAVAEEARLVDAEPLAGAEVAEHKRFGYGEPIRVRYSVNSEQRSLVLHTMAPDPFGHDRRSDRVAAMMDAYDIFDSLGHVRALDLGFIENGELVPGGRGEPFLVTEYADGELYARDLHAIASAEHAGAHDRARVRAITSYITAVASKRGSPEQYRRAIRDIVGSGEGILGLRDAYTDDDPVATPARLAGITMQACTARERLRGFEHRARHTHGDLHPFNVLFDARDGIHLLDRSRGGIGDTADDVTCMTINYLAIALLHRGSFTGALRDLWTDLWSSVVEATGDKEMLLVVPVFFAWRVLVLASPLWYPETPASVRETLLRFAERLLGGATFDPMRVDELLA